MPSAENVEGDGKEVKEWKKRTVALTIAILRALIHSGIVFHTPSFPLSIYLTHGSSFAFPMHPIWPRYSGKNW